MVMERRGVEEGVGVRWRIVEGLRKEEERWVGVWGLRKRELEEGEEDEGKT